VFSKISFSVDDNGITDHSAKEYSYALNLEQALGELKTDSYVATRHKLYAGATSGFDLIIEGDSSGLAKGADGHLKLGPSTNMSISVHYEAPGAGRSKD
jgi:hypothetical protein